MTGLVITGLFQLAGWTPLLHRQVVQYLDDDEEENEEEDFQSNLLQGGLEQGTTS